MTLDPQAKAFLDLVNNADGEPFHTLGADKAREVYAERPDYLAPEWVPVFKVKNLSITPTQHSIPLRIYTPIESTRLLPVCVLPWGWHGDWYSR